MNINQIFENSISRNLEYAKYSNLKCFFGPDRQIITGRFGARGGLGRFSLWTSTLTTDCEVGIKEGWPCYNEECYTKVQPSRSLVKAFLGAKPGTLFYTQDGLWHSKILLEALERGNYPYGTKEMYYIVSDCEASYPYSLFESSVKENIDSKAKRVWLFSLTGFIVAVWDTGVEEKVVGQRFIPKKDFFGMESNHPETHMRFQGDLVVDCIELVRIEFGGNVPTDNSQQKNNHENHQFSKTGWKVGCEDRKRNLWYFQESFEVTHPEHPPLSLDAGIYSFWFLPGFSRFNTGSRD